MEKKMKVFEIVVNGAEGSPCFSKCPASDQDVLAALHFLTDLSEMVVSIVEVKLDETENFVKC